MELRTLGKSDITVTRVGLGCMSLPADKHERTAILDAAIDGGINFFDTADLYQQGENEKWLGEYLAGKRQNVIIATKVGNRWKEDGSGWTWDASKPYILQAVHDSLRRLRTDYIDLYQLHGGMMEDEIEGAIEAFESLKQEGYIRHYGISSIRPNVIREYVRKSSIVSVMMQYSVLDRRPEEEMLPFLAANEVGVIARGPVASGRLSERVLGDKAPDSNYLDYTPTEVMDIVKGLQDLTSSDHTRTLAQIAIAYSLAHPAVSTVIPGASSLTQLQENLRAADGPSLSDEDLQHIRRISRANVYTAHR